MNQKSKFDVLQKYMITKDQSKKPKVPQSKVVDQDEAFMNRERSSGIHT
jgi:hypothetical protein